ncbi:MAG: hypothetical protein H8D26_07545, partial [Methanomicrobia archaeon]|nr:hypothetical protein [Methanomicrobia archaeon]
MPDIDEFDKKLKKIEWNKLDPLKIFTKDLFFEKGLVEEASILADELAKIPEPRDVFKTTLLYCVVGAIVSCFFSFVIGYRKG